MKVNIWGRYLGDSIEYGGAQTYMSYGVRGSGKSTLLEAIGMEFLDRNRTVIDLFGSRDGESLAWLRSPYAEEKKILLLHGDNTDVSCSWDTKNIAKYDLSDIEHYDLIISSSPLYSSIDQEYKDVNRIIDLVYDRAVWTKSAYICIREAANLLYSRMKVSKDQAMAKAMMTYFIREARHCGFSLGLDTQKLTSIDLDIRITIDYLFFKSLGVFGLPSDLSWLYKTYIPLRLQNMKPQEYLLLTKQGSHGVGTFEFHDWHKKPGEDILKACGVEVQHGEELIESKPDYRVGDFQHVEICELRIDGMSYEKIGAALTMSRTTAHNHIKKHNTSIARVGNCNLCTRAKADIATVLLQ